MSFLGHSSQQDYDNLAEKLRTYEGSEKWAIDQLAPLVNAVADLLYPTVFLAVALIGLMYYVGRLETGRAGRYLLSVAFISALMIPIQVGSAQAPASFYLFNKVTTAWLGALQSLIDWKTSSPGGAGNYAATVYSLSTYSTGVGGDDLRETELARTVYDYQRWCRPVAVETGLTQAEMETVGLAGGPLGVEVPGSAAAKARALEKLKGKSGDSLSGNHDFYYVAAREWWLARDGDKKAAPRWIKNTDPELGYKFDDGRRADPYQPERFFPMDCREFHKLADMAMREYQSAVAARAKVKALRAGISPMEDKDGLVVLGAQITAAQKVNASGQERQNSPVSKPNLASAILSGLESLLVTFAMKAVAWVAEAVTKWVAFGVPAVAALTVGGMFVVWPLFVCMALFPGRERTIPEFLYYNVFIKFFLLCSYGILKVGGWLFLKAVDQFARDGTGSMASMTFIGGLAIMIGSTVGALKFAHALTFSESRGLVGAVGMGAMGAQQIARMAQTITQRGVNLVSSPRSGPGPAPRRNLSPSRDSSRGRGAPPQGTPRAGNGTATHNARPVTEKQLRDQIDRMSGKGRK